MRFGDASVFGLFGRSVGAASGFGIAARQSEFWARDQQFFAQRVRNFRDS